MQKIIIPLICLLLFSCSKENNNVREQSIEKKIIGEWIWEATCGGYTGLCDYPKINFNVTIEFQTNNSFIQRLNDTIYNTGNYKITKKIYSTDTIYSLIFSENKILITINEAKYYISSLSDTFETSISILNDKLSIYYGDIADSYKKYK